MKKRQLNLLAKICIYGVLKTVRFPSGFKPGGKRLGKKKGR